jgi:hypothetical protein
MPDFRPAAKHGPITEIFPDVFFVTGGFGFGPGLSITRNMTIVRQKDELVLINSVRLGEEGEKELEKLGKVKHVIRTGFFHGADDPYFKHRYDATLWAAPKTGDGYEVLDNQHSPLSKAQVFEFHEGKRPEVAVLLDRDGGILVPCDSYQNWTTFEGCSFIGGIMMRMMGFGPTLIGGPWTKAMGQGVRADFDRLLEMPFQHLVPAHGTVLKDDAKPGLKTAISKRFKS